MTDAYDWRGEPGEAGAQGDDFTRIAGIGPVIKRQLHAAGIRTFQQLAAIAPEDIVRLAKDLPLLSVEQIIRQDWPGQARRLATEPAANTAADNDVLDRTPGAVLEVLAISLTDAPARQRSTTRGFQAHLYLCLRGARAMHAAVERLWYTTLLLAWSHTTGTARVLSSSRARLSPDRLVYSATLTGALAEGDRYHLAGMALLAAEGVVGHASGPYAPGARPEVARRPTAPARSARIRGIVLDAPPGQPFLAADRAIGALVRLQVEPPPARGTTCFACLLAHEPSTGRTLILGGEREELQAGRRDQVVALTGRAPGIARGQVIGAVFVPEANLLDVAAGPLLRVARQER